MWRPDDQYAMFWQRTIGAELMGQSPNSELATCHILDLVVALLAEHAFGVTGRIHCVLLEHH